MKRILPLLLAATALFFTSCKPSNEELARKIASGTDLDDTECAAVLEETQAITTELNDSILAHENDIKGLGIALRSIAAAHPEMQVFSTYLLEVDPSKISEGNRALYEKVLKQADEVQENILRIGGNMAKIEKRAADVLSGKKETADGPADVTGDSSKYVAPAPAEKPVDAKAAAPAGSPSGKAQ